MELKSKLKLNRNQKRNTVFLYILFCGMSYDIVYDILYCWADREVGICLSILLFFYRIIPYRVVSPYECEYVCMCVCVCIFHDSYGVINPIYTIHLYPLIPYKAYDLMPSKPSQGQGTLYIASHQIQCHPIPTM